MRHTSQELRNGGPRPDMLHRLIHSRSAMRILGVLVALGPIPALGLAGCPDSRPRYIVKGPFGGVQAKRGARDRPSLVFVPTSLVRFEIRPERRAERGVYATMYVEAPSGRLTRAPMDAVVPTASGGFSIEVEGRELFREGTGTYHLHVLVSDRAHFPEEPTASGLLRISGLQPVVSVPVVFRAQLAARTP